MGRGDAWACGCLVMSEPRTQALELGPGCSRSLHELAPGRGFLDLERLYFHSRQGHWWVGLSLSYGFATGALSGNYALPNMALIGSPPTKPVSAGRTWRV